MDDDSLRHAGLDAGCKLGRERSTVGRPREKQGKQSETGCKLPNQGVHLSPVPRNGAVSSDHSGRDSGRHDAPASKEQPLEVTNDYIARPLAALG
ncbi:MAG: hypothetical protein PVG53_12195 [Holophagae bacterium]